MKNNNLKYLGASWLDDFELIASVLEPFELSCDEEDHIAREVLRLLDRNKTIYYSTLMKINGMKAEIASLIVASLELSRRWPKGIGKKILSSADAFLEVRHYANREYEQVIVMAINGAKEVLFTEVVALGSVSCCSLALRDVFTDALRSRARGIIIAHNHPTNNLDVSTEDKDFTKKVYELGRMLGVTLLDHLIISESDYVSLGKLGFIPNED